MDIDPSDDFLIGQTRIRVVINLFGCDDVDFVVGGGQVQRQIG
jgi:hypothetical protein